MCICAQRLLRRLCTCKQPDDPKPEERILLERALDDRPVGKLMRPVGCEKCNSSGYRGRLGTHELLKNSDELRAMINRKATVEQLKQAAREAGMRTLFEDLMEKVKLGLTSLQEAIGTARPDDTHNPARPAPKPSASATGAAPKVVVADTAFVTALASSSPTPAQPAHSVLQTGTARAAPAPVQHAESAAPGQPAGEGKSLASLLGFDADESGEKKQ